MSKPLMALLVAVAAIATIAAGCGSSDDSTESTSSLTKAEFLKQGNAICAKGNEEIDSEFEEFAKENNLSENKKPSEDLLTEAAEDILIPAVDKQLVELRDLGAPEGEEGEVDKILSAAEEALEEGEEDPGVLTSEGSPFTEVNKMARDYGLTTCGEE